MKNPIVSFVLTAVIAVSSTVAVANFPMMDEERGVLTNAPLLGKTTPGVDNISVKTRVMQKQNPLYQDPFFRRFFDVPNQLHHREAMSAGSGVIVDAKEGLVMTNHHVIDNAVNIMVTLKDKRQIKAELIGSDAATDIALLQIDAEDLTAVPFGNSDKIQVGDVVIAIGNPFGIGQTVTTGIVSALGRSGLGIEGYEDFVQTDASINPGNSGGALVNSKGELVGINTAIIGPSGGNVGIGFAVPSNMAMAVLDQLKVHGKVSRGRLGVTVQDLTPEIAEAMDLSVRSGALITGVESTSPAEKAGLKPGDVIAAIDGKPLRGFSDLRNRIGLTRKGSEVEISYLREGAQKTVTARIGDLDFSVRQGSGTLKDFSGARFEDYKEIGAKPARVMVADVVKGSAAWHHGLRKDNVITVVNNKPVASVDELISILQRPYKGVAMNVKRDGRDLFIVVERKEMG